MPVVGAQDQDVEATEGHQLPSQVGPQGPPSARKGHVPEERLGVQVALCSRHCASVSAGLA
eukprot:2103606-Lingulodinium_polyedra.AAC.1